MSKEGTPAPARVSAFDRVFPRSLRSAEAALLYERRTGAAREGDPKPPAAEQLVGAIGTDSDDRVGVALSGGGIRSATFCLGVFQGLARGGLLGRIDYLSTVSGGGFFGGFLGRLFTREWTETVRAEDLPPGDEDLLRLKKPVERIQAVLARSDSWCVRYLRNCGRYINPNNSGDAWLAIAMFLRNWIAVLVVLWTLALGFFSVLTAIRAALWPLSLRPGRILGEAWLAQHPVAGLWWSPWVLAPIGVFVFLAVPRGLAYWFTQETWAESRYPFIRWLHGNISRVSPIVILIVAIAVTVTGSRGRFLDDRPWLAWGVVGQLLLAVLFWRIAVSKSPDPRTHDGERNVLARGLARMLRLSWWLFAVATVDALGQSFYAAQSYAGTSGLGESPVALLGGLLGLAGIAAFAQRIAQFLQQLPQLKSIRVPMGLVGTLAGIGLLTLFLGSASYAAHRTAWDGREPGIELVADASLADAVLRPGALLTAPDTVVGVPANARVAKAIFLSRSDRRPSDAVAPKLMQMVGVGSVALLLSILFGLTYPFFNLSSLHSFYRARLSRAYLGASNRKRFQRDYTSVVAPIEDDDVNWEDYHPWKRGGPLHIVNQTLNQTVSGSSQIEYRDRKGMNVAVGPAGLTAGTHHHARWGDLTASGSGPDPAAPQKPLRRIGWEARSLRPITPLNVLRDEFHAFGTPARDETTGPVDFGAVSHVERRTLGRNVAISGAAFTTGIGFRTRLGTSLLAGLFNVRLGYWWTVQVDRKQFAKDPHRPIPLSWAGRAMDRLFHVQARLIDELTARFRGPLLKRWYLSDGGHFENMALYELVRRRVPFIVACDCGQDRDYGFNDMSVLTRHIRTDFGAELEVLDDHALTQLHVHPAIRRLLATPEAFVISGAGVAAPDGPPRRTGGHALLARLKYVAQDGLTEACAPSYILFVKPSLTGDEPQDVLNYQATNRDFPNESTVDQDFDEGQWESYRCLGQHIAEQLFADLPRSQGWRPLDLCRP